MRFIISLITNAIVLFLMALVFPKSLQFDSFTTTLLAAVIIGICNIIAFKTLLGQIVVLISLALSSILGWFGVLFTLFAIETLFLFIADKILDGMTVGGFWWGMLTVLFLTLVSMFSFKTNKT